MSEWAWLADSQWLWLAIGFFAGVAGTLWLGELLSWGQAPSPTTKPEQARYVETRIRLVQSTGNKLYFEASDMKNIYLWKQVYARAESRKSGEEAEVVIHTDHFFFIFEHPVQYEWPRVESFGYSFPMYNFWATSDRGAVMQVSGEITAPVFEVRFPPPTGQATPPA